MRFSASLLQETHSVLPEINKQNQSHSMQAENAWIQSFENLCTTAQSQRKASSSTLRKELHYFMGRTDVTWTRPRKNGLSILRI